MASAVSAGDGGQYRHDATIIGELRTVRARIGAKLSMSITLEEVDALLRAVDERDELRRQTVGDFEAGFLPVKVETIAAREGCPRRDTIHDCPLGGCADTTPRISEIPDLPPTLPNGNIACSVEPIIGREERETPPMRTPRSHATMCSGRDDGGGCFVPWCSCECHTRRSDVAPAR